MFRCQCYQIGGPFIAEDPDCPAHGTYAQSERRRKSAIASKLRYLLQNTQLDVDARETISDAIDALED